MPLPREEVTGTPHGARPLAPASDAVPQPQVLPNGAAPIQSAASVPADAGPSGKGVTPHEPRLTLDQAFGERVGVTLARRVAEGGEEVQIRMDPAELGRIHVRLSFDDGGSLRAVVAADSPQVLETLRRDTAELQRSLTDAGVRTDGQSFRFDRGQHSGAGQDSAHRHPQQGASRWASDGSTEASEEPAAYRPLRRSGRFDLMA